MPNIAVYGTLKKGECNHKLIDEPETEFLGVDLIREYVLYEHGLPYATKGDGFIIVETYYVDKNTFEAVEHLEGYPHHYDRAKVKTVKGKEVSIYFSHGKLGRRIVLW